jgi:hypothetical protein
MKLQLGMTMKDAIAGLVWPRRYDMVLPYGDPHAGRIIGLDRAVDRGHSTCGRQKAVSLSMVPHNAMCLAAR